MADLKSVYLVHGDDDAKIDQWRGRLRKRAEAEHGPGALEHFHAASATPDDVVASVLALTFATGTRYILCLLYTSPSPRDRTRSRMPSSA